MSHLKLFAPDESGIGVTAVAEDYPATIPFATGSTTRRNSRIPFGAAITRARALYENQCCPRCRHATVEPLELGDAIISPRNYRPIPGTATVVGFHCHSCGHEWPVYYTSPESA